MKSAFLPLLLCCTTLASPLVASDWPQWRGPNRTDLSSETGLLKTWPEGGPKKLWTFSDAGLGYSGPAIVNGKIYTLGTRSNKEVMLSLDAATGKEIWYAELGPIFAEGHGNGPRGTPTVDGNMVYALSGTGVLCCLNSSDGKLLWKKSMTELGGNVAVWGYTESVLVDGDKLICTPGGSNGALAAFDKKSGDLLWQSKEFKDGAQYSSMVPADINGKHQYVQLTMQSLVGIDAKDGSMIWKSPWQGRTAVIPTPIVKDNYIYITSGYGVGCKLVKIDAENKPSDVYVNKVIKNHHGGVVLVGENLYGYSDGSGWVCQNFMSGEEVWADKKLGKGAIAYADGMLYCLDESTGTIALIEASPKGWTEHGRFTLDPQSRIRTSQGRVWTHPVINNGVLYLRDQDLIIAYQVK
ncbi:MAG: bamB 1 [Verrucomicrobiales bacterium]|nr:bamB 1 [Verrucomicrobiales bacterium]